MGDTFLKNITLGTAGHIDHGKTALIKLLTGCDTDRLRAEKERGMSIELGFAPCQLADLEVGIVDVPGHENFIKTMVAGASGIDATLFVVAADDGVMPQTQEHLDILTLLGVQNGIVALTKIDMVSAERRQEVIEELAIFLDGTFLEGVPVLPVSSITGEGFSEFYEGLKTLVKQVTPKTTEGVFRQPVERTFSVKGYGTVISGIPVTGQAQVGDEVVVHPAGTKGRIKALQVYQHQSEVVRCGQCAALNVPQWDVRDVGRGHVVTLDGYFQPETWYLCCLDALNFMQFPLKNGSQIKFHTGTFESMATLYFLEGNRLIPGQEQLIQVCLDQPAVAGPHDRFILRTHAPARTVGGGYIVEALERKIRRSRPEAVTDAWERARAVKDPQSFLEYCIRNASGHAVNRKSLQIRCKLTEDQITPLLEALLAAGCIHSTEGKRYLHTQSLELIRKRLDDVLLLYHQSEPGSPGMPPADTQQALGLEKDVFDKVIQNLEAQDKLGIQKGRLAHPDYFTKVDPALQKLFDEIEPLFKETPYAPPKLKDLATELRIPPHEVTKKVKLLAEHERLVRVDGDMYFHKEAIDRACQLAIDHIKSQGNLESVQFKYLLDTTRKFAIPLLDYLDRIGITRRAADNTRFLGHAALKMTDSST